MKTSEFNNVLNNKYTSTDVLSSLELNNLIKNPGRKKGNMSRKIILNKRTWLRSLTIKAGKKSLWTAADFWLVSAFSQRCGWHF